MKFRKGIKFKSLTTNESRIKDRIYTIIRDSDNACWYVSEENLEVNVGTLTEIKLLISDEIGALDMFQSNFRNGV